MGFRGELEALQAQLAAVETERDLLAARLEALGDKDAELDARSQHLDRLEARLAELEPLPARLEGLNIANRGLRERIKQLEAEAGPAPPPGLKPKAAGIVSFVGSILFLGLLALLLQMCAHPY